jgi:hypothetical protein
MRQMFERKNFWLRPTYAFFNRQELLLVALSPAQHAETGSGVAALFETPTQKWPGAPSAKRGVDFCADVLPNLHRFLE